MRDGHEQETPQNHSPLFTAKVAIDARALPVGTGSIQAASCRPHRKSRPFADHRVDGRGGDLADAPQAHQLPRLVVLASGHRPNVGMVGGDAFIEPGDFIGRIADTDLAGRSSSRLAASRRTVLAFSGNAMPNSASRPRTARRALPGLYAPTQSGQRTDRTNRQRASARTCQIVIVEDDSGCVMAVFPADRKSSSETMSACSTCRTASFTR